MRLSLWALACMCVLCTYLASQAANPRLDLLDVVPRLRELVRNRIWPDGINSNFTAYVYPLVIALLLFGPQVCGRMVTPAPCSIGAPACVSASNLTCLGNLRIASYAACPAGCNSDFHTGRCASERPSRIYGYPNALSLLTAV